MQAAERRDARTDRVRLTFDVSEKMKRDVKIEAVRRGLTVREYLTDLVARDRKKVDK